MLYNMVQMDRENLIPFHVKSKESGHDCCKLRTSEKVRYMLAQFPEAQQVPSHVLVASKLGLCRKCITPDCKSQHPIPSFPFDDQELKTKASIEVSSSRSENMSRTEKVWVAVSEVVQLLQLIITAAALLLYYFIYGWMQFVYTGLQVAAFFRKADGPMKITLGVVTATTLVVAFNILVRIQNFYYGFLR